MLKSFIAKWLVRPFKSIGIFGRQRFWVLYWAYRITGWHIRHREWDFVLEYLPKLEGQLVTVLDVGCSRNLFIHELLARGYKTRGIDLENLWEPIPKGFRFIKDDIRSSVIENNNFVTCISVLEHIEQNRDFALDNMIQSLTPGGRLLITIPTMEFAQTHPWLGFTYKGFLELLPKNARVIEYTERAGQMCMAIERTK